MDLKDKSILILAILIVFIGSVSAEEINDTVAIENTDLSVSDTLETISVNENVEINTSTENNFEVVETNNVENENNNVSSVATIRVPTAQTFAAIQTQINSASAGDTIKLSGTYAGSGTQIEVNKNLDFVGENQATLDAKTLSRIVFLDGAYTITFTNITFKNGKLEEYSSGGAVYIRQGSGYFTNCNFTSNAVTTSYGGAVFIYGGTSGNFTNCTFTSNSAGGSFVAYGGAVYIYKTFGNFTNCTFTSNTASIGGGAVLIGDTSCDFTNCTFTSNTASSEGGAVYIYASGSGNFTNCTFTSNTASSEGGAVCIYSSGSGNFTNCTFSDNVSDKNKEVIFMSGDSSSLFLRGNSIVTNSTPIYIDSGVVTSSTVLVVLNNQTVKSPVNTQIDITAVLYDDNGNIIGSNTGITLNIAESILTASFNRENLNYNVTYTPMISGIFPVTGTVPTTVADNVSEYKKGTLITGFTTLSQDLLL